MQFGSYTRARTENYSIQFTWSLYSNKGFPYCAKENKHSLYAEDEYFPSVFHFGKRCASHSTDHISFTTHFLILFQSCFNLMWMKVTFLVPSQ